MKGTVQVTIAVFRTSDLAIARDGEGLVERTLFIQVPGGVNSQIPTLSALNNDGCLDGEDSTAFVTRPRHGTWLFPPHDYGGVNDKLPVLA